MCFNSLNNSSKSLIVVSGHFKIILHIRSIKIFKIAKLINVFNTIQNVLMSCVQNCFGPLINHHSKSKILSLKTRVKLKLLYTNKLYNHKKESIYIVKHIIRFICEIICIQI